MNQLNRTPRFSPFAVPCSFHLLCLLSLLWIPSVAFALAPPKLGDVNGSGRVDIEDAVWTLQAATGLRSLSPEAYSRADVNGDGAVEISDAVKILQAAVSGAVLQPPFAVSTSASARFQVDVNAGRVSVTSLSSPSSSTSEAVGTGGLNRRDSNVVVAGSRVSFNSSTLIDEPGDTGLKVLNVSLTNHSGFPLGQLPNGTLTGVKAIFSDIQSYGSTPDLRPRTQVNTLAGGGGVACGDGALNAADFGPIGVAVDPEGAVYIADYGCNKIRKIHLGQVTTLAGSGAVGSADGTGTGATFNKPWGIAYNPLDEAVYVTEYAGHRVRRITREGVVTTVAGTGTAGDTGGAGNLAQFRNPSGMAVDETGRIFLTENTGHRVRRITFTGTDPSLASSYTVALIAGSPTPGHLDATGASARFHTPHAVAVGGGGVLYVADAYNHRVRRISASLVVTTVAGTGVQSSGDGSGETATFSRPFGIVSANGAVYVSEVGQVVRQLTLRSGGDPTKPKAWQVVTLAGLGGAAGYVDGSGDVARFNVPYGLAERAGVLYVGDYNNRRVRRVYPPSVQVQVGEPDGSAPSERVQVSNADGVIPTSEVEPGTLTRITRPYFTYAGGLANGATSEVKKWAFDVPAGVSAFEFVVTVEADTDTKASPPAVDGTLTGGVGSPDVWVRTLAGSDQLGFLDGSAAQARFDSIISGLAVDREGNVFFADYYNDAIRRISKEGWVSTVAGVEGSGNGTTDGTGNLAKFYRPSGVAVTPDGKTLYVVDRFNRTVRRIVLTGSDPTDPTHWSVSTIAGLAGSFTTVLTSGTNDATTGNNARFLLPAGIAMDSGGNLYVTEDSANRVRRLKYLGGDPALPQSWYVKIVAGQMDGTSGSADGTGWSASFQGPVGIAADASGNLYVAENDGHRVRRITNPGGSLGGTVSLLAGSAAGTVGYLDSSMGASARFYNPIGVAVDTAGYVYVGDWHNWRIRRISPSGAVRTVAGTGVQGWKDGSGDVATFTHPNGMAVDASGNLYVGEASRVRLIQRILR